MAQNKTPLLRSFRSSGGTIYTFPSATEDIGLNLNERGNKVALTHYALLEIPESDTSKSLIYIDEDVTPEERAQLEEDNKLILSENRFNPTNISGHRHAANSKPATQPSFYVASSLQNYVMNFETLLRNDASYDYTAAATVSERVFWKWLKECGAIRWEWSPTSKTFVEEPEYKVINGLSTRTGYTRVVKSIGEISAGSHRTDTFGMFNETYVNVPTSYGQSVQHFKVTEDANYILGKAYQADSELEGRAISSNQTVYTENIPYCDINSTSNSDNYFLTSTGKSWWNVSGSEGENRSLGPFLPGEKYYLTDNPLTESNLLLGELNDTLYHDIYTTTPDGDILSSQTGYIRSRLDGVSLVKNIEELRRIYGRLYGDLGIPLSDLTYDRIAIDEEFVISSEFNFNTVLIYYSIFDNNDNSILSTNLYGVLFLDSPNTDNTNITLNTGAETKFYIPSLRKVQSSGTRFGTSYSFKLNAKTLEVYDNTDAIIEDNTTAQHMLSDDFNSVLYNLRKSVELLGSQTVIVNNIASKYRQIENHLKANTDSLNILETNVKSVLNNKFGFINAQSVSANSIRAQSIENVEGYGDITIKIDGDDIGSFNEEGLDLSNLNVNSIKYNDTYQKLNYISSEVVDDNYIQDVINSIKIEYASIADPISTSIADDVKITDHNKEFMILPESFTNIEDTLPYLLKSATSDNHRKTAEINYVKMIPLIIRFLQSINTDYLIKGLTFILKGNPEEDLKDNVVYLDADGTIRDKDGVANTSTLSLDIVVQKGSLNISVLYPITPETPLTLYKNDNSAQWIYINSVDRSLYPIEEFIVPGTGELYPGETIKNFAQAVIAEYDYRNTLNLLVSPNVAVNPSQESRVAYLVFTVTGERSVNTGESAELGSAEVRQYVVQINQDQNITVIPQSLELDPEGDPVYSTPNMSPDGKAILDVEANAIIDDEINVSVNPEDDDKFLEVEEV